MMKWIGRYSKRVIVLPLPLAVFLLFTGCTNSGIHLFDRPMESPRVDTGEPSQISSPPLNIGSQFGNGFGEPPTAPSSNKEVLSAPTLSEVLAPGDLPEMFLGRADAPVTIVLYASLSCPYCRAFLRDVFPELKKDYIDKGKVRLVVREFPIGKSSGNATIALRCAPADQYFVLFSKYLENQSLWVSQEVRLDQIFAIAQQVGMKREKFDACLQNQSLISSLQKVKDRGRKLGIVGTPNFFIQNVLVKKTLTLREMQAMVDPLLGPVQASNFR